MLVLDPVLVLGLAQVLVAFGSGAGWAWAECKFRVLDVCGMGAGCQWFGFNVGSRPEQHVVCIWVLFRSVLGSM